MKTFKVALVESNVTVKNAREVNANGSSYFIVDEEGAVIFIAPINHVLYIIEVPSELKTVELSVDGLALNGTKIAGEVFKTSSKE